MSKKIVIYVKFNPDRKIKPNTQSKSIVMFISKHLDMLNNTGNFIDIMAIDETNEEAKSQLKNTMKIKKLPALCYRNLKPVYGPHEIKNALKKLSKSGRRPAVKSDEEDVRSYHMELMKMNEEGNGENDGTMDVAKATIETRRRTEQFEDRNKHKMGHRVNGGRATRDPRAPNKRIYDNAGYDDMGDGDNQPANDNRGRVAIKDNPAEIQRAMSRNGNGDASRDDDLMAKFWENNSETKV